MYVKKTFESIIVENTKTTLFCISYMITYQLVHLIRIIKSNYAPIVHAPVPY